MSRIAPAIAALFLAACATTTSPDQELVSDDDAFGKLGGFVTDINGEPIADVLVSAQGFEFVTDDEGRYLLDGLDPSADFTVEFWKSGFAKGYTRSTIVSWETASANKVMLHIDGSGAFEAADGGTVVVEVDGGRDLTVSFPPSALVDTDGNLYDGTVVVEITYVNPRDDTLLGAPGDLAALAFPKSGDAKEANEPTQLVSYGMADITPLDEDGEPLQLVEGEVAGVTLPVNDDGVASAYALGLGQEQVSWSYSGDRGLWIEEGVGAVGEDDDGMTFEFEASHFSWWNCDQGFTPTCAQGRVVDYLGFPVRSAEIVARGSQTNSIGVTDEDGFYTIAVMAGDTVSVEGTTFVADRNWSDKATAYIDCPDGDHFCEVDANGMDGECFPVPEIQIPVCRESGVVMTDNITSHLSATEADNGDRLRAFFWEAPGDIEYCVNPWDDIPMEQCQVVDTDDYTTPHDMDGVDGIPMDLRPVGDWIELSTGRDTYVLNQEMSNGKPFYTFQTENYSEGSVDYLETNDIDLRGGDVISAVAPGDLSAGMGAIEESSWVSLPAEFTSNGISGPQTIATSSSLSLNFTAANNGDGILVIGGSVEVNGNGLADKNDTFLMCRFNDDGSIKIPGGELDEIDRGATALSIFRPEISWTSGPDGMPIRVQAFSGTSVQVELQ